MGGIGLLDLIAQGCQSLATTVAPSVQTLGIHMVLALATIMMVWFGVQEALASASGGPGFDMRRFISFFILITFAYSFVNFYNTAIPGIGTSLKGFIDGGTTNLVQIIGQDSYNTMTREIDAAAQNMGSSMPSILLSPYKSFVFFMVQMALCVASLLISAIVAYGVVASTIIGLLGPIFIPFLVFEKLDWLFWGWLKAYLGFSFYKVIAATTMNVLPFENLGAHPELEYMADGLTEEVIAALGHVDPEHLSVIGRTSVMAYKRTTKLLADIGRELGARFLVESSLRGENGRLRIISKLIRAHDQVQIWSASYDSEPGSVLDFQRELSGAIAEQVRLRLSPDLVVALGGRQTRHAEAYDLYLRGRYFWNQLSAPATRRAVEFFTRATELDPGYALAWSGLATAWASGPISGDAPPLQLWPRSREASAHAVAGGSGLAEVQTSLGMLKFWLDWDWCAAVSALRKALDLDPSYSQAQRLLGVALSHMGRSEEGQEAARRARELDPFDADRKS